MLIVQGEVGAEILCECSGALKNRCSKGQGEGVKSGYIKGLMIT